MYTKKIVFLKLLHDRWIEQSLRTTDDAVWWHLEQFRLRTDVKDVKVVDIEPTM